MDRIRILSDLHLDVNNNYCFKLQKNNDFTILAGDTSGDPAITIEWVKKNVKKGLLVSGNHLVYNEHGLPIQKLRDELHSAFPVDNDVTYLESECDVVCKEVDGILFLGSCLYTDMKLSSPYRNPNGVVDINCNIAQRYLNDFRWGLTDDIDTVTDANEGLRRIRAKDYIKWFEKTVAKFEQILSENEALSEPKPVVIVTHHAPSRMCVGSAYVDDDANCAYVSELDEFINKHTSIKCWIYGHIHEHKEIDITRADGSTCVLINNSRGYCRRVEDRDFNPNTFLNTKTWKIESEQPSKSAQAKLKKRQSDYSKRLEQMMAMGFF